MDVAGEAVKEKHDNFHRGESCGNDQSAQPLLSPKSPSKTNEMKIDITKVELQTQNSLQVPTLQKQQSALGPLRIAVYVKRDKRLDGGEGGHYILELEKGRPTSAGEVKDKMLDILAIPKSSAHLFAMWLISPYLELQLKYHHPPFYLRKQWCELLIKLSTCPQEELHLDEPVLVFQRNSFITIEEERKDTEVNVLKQLFEEASFNILNARYPISIPDAEMLGGILLRCYEGEFKAEVHKPGIFKKRLAEFLPYYAIGSNKISQAIYSSGAEQRLLQQYQMASKMYEDKLACYTAFLDYCRKLDFYGCAFFKGSCFQEDNDYKIWKNERQDVTLALNRYGITLFKDEMEETLAHLPYNQFSWDLKDDEVDEKGLPIHRLIIEYDEDEETRQIQIISKQSCLMDAMVQSCVNFISDIPTLNTDVVRDRRKLFGISYKAGGSEVTEGTAVSA